VKIVGYLKHLGLILNKWPANCLFPIKTASLLTSSLIDLVYIHLHKKTQESQDYLKLCGSVGNPIKQKMCVQGPLRLHSHRCHHSHSLFSNIPDCCWFWTVHSGFK